ncbi:MAG: hypothetical protein BroJett033_3870 [Chloroflexota bacterium]|nr:MAG: hypothetical protein BroJett033_3870 [Chloroflexota bacterium]
MGEYRIKAKPKRRGMWPVIGLVLALALGVIAWVVAPAVYAFIRQRLPAFSIGAFTEQQMTIFVAVLVFALLVALASVIVAAFAPRRGKYDTRDAALRKEKNAMLREERERKERRREVEAKTRKYNREQAMRNEELRRKQQEREE